MDLKITKVSDVFMRIEGDRGLLMEISDIFTFTVPGAKYMPSVKNKYWDGKIRLFNLNTRMLYVGLLVELLNFAKLRDYQTEVDKNLYTRRQIPDEKIETFIKWLDLKFTPRDYQQAAFKHCIENKRAVMLSPTASGKSLIIYMLTRFFADQGKEVLIIVPTVSLVTQMVSDFQDYNKGRELDVHSIMAGVDKNVMKSITVTTWQSVYKMPKAWFSRFDCVIGDECHQFKSKSLTGIMEKLDQTQNRFGFTGTLDGSQTNEMVLKGLFGPVNKVTTTKHLIDKGQLSQLKIKALVLKYPQDECKDIKRKTYQEEIDFIVAHERRNKFIVNLVSKLSGNTLVLFRYVDKHGKPLYNSISNIKDNVFFVAGQTESDDRESIRHLIDSMHGGTIVASVGTFSTGVNIRNIHNIVFTSPTKSRVTNLQSIGRGLRLGDNKQLCTVFDIADDLTIGSYQNHTIKHFNERVKIYDSEHLQYKIYNYEI